MLTKPEKDYFSSVRKARYVAECFRDLLEFKPKAYETLGQLENQYKKYKNAVRFAARSVAGRQYRYSVGSLLAQSLLQQESRLYRQRCYKRCCRNLKRTCSIISLKNYHFKIRQLAGFLTQLPIH